MITSLMTIPIAPLYLLTTDYTMIVVFFTLQGFFGGGGMHTQWPHYLSERFPTEVRATATGFCYHQGAIFGGLVGPVAGLLRHRLAHGLRDTDDDRHHRRRVLGRHRDGVQPRNEGHASWFRIFNWREALPGRGRTTVLIRISAPAWPPSNPRKSERAERQ